MYQYNGALMGEGILTTKIPKFASMPRRTISIDIAGRVLNITVNASFSSFFSPDSELNL